MIPPTTFSPLAFVVRHRDNPAINTAVMSQSPPASCPELVPSRHLAMVPGSAASRISPPRARRLGALGRRGPGGSGRPSRARRSSTRSSPWNICASATQAASPDRGSDMTSSKDRAVRRTPKIEPRVELAAASGSRSITRPTPTCGTSRTDISARRIAVVTPGLNTSARSGRSSGLREPGPRGEGAEGPASVPPMRASRRRRAGRR
jgi:hypothetical protein